MSNIEIDAGTQTIVIEPVIMSELIVESAEPSITIVPSGLPGPSGVTGPTGATGAIGPAGTDGKSVLNGTGAPTGGVGVDGDFYIDTTSDSIYGPKTSDVWGSPTSLVGPTGATGPAGPVVDLDALLNVDTTGKASSDSLTWNGTDWVDTRLVKKSEDAVASAASRTILTVPVDGTDFNFLMDATGIFGGVTDPVMFMGWNVGPLGTQPNAAEGSVWVAIEHDYMPGADHLSEAHIAFKAPGDIAETRMISGSFDWTTGTVSTSMRADDFTLTDVNDLDWFAYISNTLTVDASVVIAKSSLTLGLTDGTQNAALKLNYNSAGAGVIDYYDETGPKWSLGVMGGHFYVYDDANGTPSIDLTPGVSTASIATFAGQVRATATAPSDPSDLTRKDYVDGLVDDLSGVTDSGTARTNLGLGSAATHASTDFDSAGAAGAALTSAEAYTDTAVALRVLKAGDTMTGALASVQASGSAVAFSAKVTGDTLARWQVAEDGTQTITNGTAVRATIYPVPDSWNWGTAGIAIESSSTNLDMGALWLLSHGADPNTDSTPFSWLAPGAYSLARYTAGNSSLSGEIDIEIMGQTPGIQIYCGATADVDTTEVLRLSSWDDTGWRYSLKASGKQSWGTAGGATDTNLYRSAAGTLKTDGSFLAAKLGVNASAFGTVEKLRVNTPTTVDNLASAVLAANATTDRPLVVQGSAGQTANLQEWQNSAGTVNASIGANGGIDVLTSGTRRFQITATGISFQGAPISGYGVIMNPVSTSTVNLGVRATAAQTASLQEWQSSTPTTLARITAAGVFQVNSTGTPGTVELFRVTAPTTVDNSANVVIAASATTAKPLVVQGAASQSANSQEWQNSAGTVLAQMGTYLTVTSSGSGITNGTTNAYGARQAINTVANGNIGLVIRAAGPSQTADLQEWQKSDGTVLSRINWDGSGFFSGYGGSAYALMAQCGIASSSAILAKGYSAQSANLQEWQNSSSGVLGYVTAGGNIAAGGSTGALSTTGTFRLPNTGSVSWRNAANSGDVVGIMVDANNKTVVGPGTPTTNDSAADIMIAASATTAHPLSIQGIASQTANLTEWQNSAGGVSATVGTGGVFTVGNNTNIGAMVNINTVAAANIGLAIKAVGSQSGDLTHWKDSSGNVLARVSAAGILQVNSTGTPGTVEKFRVGTPTTVDNTGDALLSASSSTARALVLQAAAAPSTAILSAQTSTGTISVNINANGMTFGDASDINLGTTTGSKIGTGTTQKLSFWNKTPIVQPTTGIAAAAFVANTSAIVNDTATFGGYTIGQIAAALINVGILA